MLTWLNLAGFWWLLLIPALLLLYILRQRPQRLRVSSLRLWRTVPQVEQARPRLRRPPLSLLLLLQLLLLLAGAFALMQPALTAPAGKHLIILLDASGSMQAADASGTRFSSAQAQARTLINAAARTDDVTLLRVGDNVDLSCANCPPDAARSALDALRPGSGGSDLRGALSLATEQMQRWPAGTAQTVLISDGGFDAATLDILPSTLRVITVGGPVENRAITVVSARQPPDGTPGYEVYARVENFGTSSAAIQITAKADTIPQPGRKVTLPGGGHADLIWQLPAGTARFSASISPGDALKADDAATLLLPAGAHNRVLIEAPDAELYLRALGALPGVEPIISAGGGDASAAIAIVNGTLPDPMPAGGVLLVDPDESVIPRAGIMSAARPLPGATGPLLSGVDLGALLVLSGKAVEPRDWLQTVVDSDQGPLILAGEREGRRVVVLTFDPADSNLTTLAAFPLLMANVVDWLYPLAGTQALQPGQSLNLAPGTTITTPSGRTVKVDDSGVFADTEEAGLYTVSAADIKTTFAVNMTDASESAAPSASHPELQRQPNIELPPLQLTQQQFWSPLVAIALILLAAEWLYYCLKRGRTA